MLNFSTLDAVYNKYVSTHTTYANKANEMIKAITAKFATMPIDTIEHNWTDEVDGFNRIELGLVWSEKEKKVMFRIEDSEPEVLLGQSATIRIACIPQLHRLVELAEFHLSLSIASMIKDGKDRTEDEEVYSDEKFWAEGPNGEPSQGDQMMSREAE